MNDKLIIEKLKERVSNLQTIIRHCDSPTPDNPRFEMVLELTKKDGIFKSELSLLEQNKGKEETAWINSIYDKLREDLRHARLQTWLTDDTDDNDHLPLVDYLSTGDDISSGIEEINNIVEQIEIEDLLKGHSASPTLSKPSDYDIENAALDYVDEESNHFVRQAKRAAYIAGATHMRDNEIYISPNSKSEE